VTIGGAERGGGATKVGVFGGAMTSGVYAGFGGDTAGGFGGGATMHGGKVAIQHGSAPLNRLKVVGAVAPMPRSTTG
jgi:hypothetical protein